jgi:hypothetical protein
MHLASEVHDAHATTSDFSEDGVSPRECQLKVEEELIGGASHLHVSPVLGHEIDVLAPVRVTHGDLPCQDSDLRLPVARQSLHDQQMSFDMRCVRVESDPAYPFEYTGDRQRTEIARVETPGRGPA